MAADSVEVSALDLEGPRTRRMRVSAGEVAYDVVGRGSPIVLTHGTPSWSYLWRRIAPRLAKTHTVYLWDLIGYGSSWPDVGVRPSIALHAATLAELVEVWQLERPALVGHDIGGGATLRAHLVHQVAARQMVILDAAVFPPWIGPGTAHMQRHIDAYRSMPNGMFHHVLQAHLAETVHHPMDPAAVHAYLDLYSTDAGQQRWLDRTEGFTESDTTDFLDRLGGISIPTQVIWGAEDTWLAPDLGRRLAAAIPHARFTLVPGAGHFLIEDAPDEVGTLLLSALAS